MAKKTEHTKKRTVEQYENKAKIVDDRGIESFGNCVI